jgi:hypothetical protein
MITLYAVAGITGLIAAYQFYSGRVEKYTKYLSLFAIGIGIVATSILFIMGLLLNGIIGPAWVIFIVNAFALWLTFRPTRK